MAEDKTRRAVRLAQLEFDEKWTFSIQNGEAKYSAKANDALVIVIPVQVPGLGRFGLLCGQGKEVFVHGGIAFLPEGEVTVEV